MNKRYQKRDYYINKIKPFIDADIIKVLVGQRRVGKSYILLQLMDEIKLISKNANLVYINKEENEFDFIRNYKDLIVYAENKIKKNVNNYLFIDEIQDIVDFEKALRHLSAKKVFDLYCTGSNSKLMSSELATGLSGRYVEIPIFPLSYKEFLSFHRLKFNDESFLQYIRYGGLPFLINLELSDDIVYSYLRSIYNTIVLKDVVARFHIRNVNFLNRLLEYLADNVGSLLSAKRINDFLKSQKTQTTPNKILDYLSHLSASFIIRKVSRAEIQGRKIFEINEKYYFEDLGIRNSLIAYKSSDISKVLENLVFLHLLRLGCDVYVGQLNDKEIDFIAEKNGNKIYIQVVYIINHDDVQQREFGNLLKIKDNHTKIVVSLDRLINKNYQGIKHYNIMEFLIDDNLLSF